MNNIKLAKQITNSNAKTYSKGIKMFPKEIQNATYSLYMFVREADDIIDETNKTEEDAKIDLINWINNWNNYYENNTNQNISFILLKQTLDKYNIPKHLIDDFLQAMIQDTNKNRYESYQELKTYMHGSAEVIGQIMAIILEADPHAYTNAKALGEAFQLTNFIRDIKEDYNKRNRIYIPNNILIKHNSSHKDIEDNTLTPELIETIKYLIKYNRDLYNLARQGIHAINPKTQFGITLAINLYEAILTQIEKENYNIFEKKIYVKTIDKIIIYFKTKIKFRISKSKYYYHTIKNFE
jgi:phytoene synthase